MTRDEDVTWGDNVIYADFGARRADGGRAAGEGRRGRGRRGRRGRRGTPARSARPRTDLGRVLFDAVADRADDGRRQRGERYFFDGNVLGYRLVDGQVVGEVRGSQLEPFTVVIKLPYREPGVAEGILTWLAGTGGAMDDLRRGTMPAERMAELLVDADEAPGIRCTCPDPAPTCKHAIAVAAAAGRAIDDEPMNAMELRGIGAHEARHRLAAMAAMAAREAESAARRSRPARRPTGPRTGDPVLRAVERDFWGADLPEVDVPAPEPMNPLRDTDPTLLHHALRPTTVLSVETLRAVSDLEDCWDHLVAPPSFDDAGFDDAEDARRGDGPGPFVFSFGDDDE